MPYFDGSKARLFYVDEGEGPPLVLVNGLIMTTSHWVPQVDALAGKFRIIRYDQRNQGRSSVHERFHYGELVDDLRELLDHLDVPRASICGISYGSFVAKEFAVRFPARCDRLALIASMRRIDPHLRCVYDVWLALLNSGRLREFAQSVTMLSYDRPWPSLVRENHDATLDKFVQRYTGEQVAALLESFDDVADLSNHAKIAAPTLVIGATRDRIHAPGDSASIADAIPFAHLAMVDGSHAITLDRAGDVNRLLADFFGSQH